MRYHEWQYLSRYPKNLLQDILALRKVGDQKDFLEADYRKLVASDVLDGLSQANKKIKKAISENQTIAIFCDYDADGVCSGAILYKTLKILQASKVIYYVPDRSEGYSLNDQAIDYFVSNQANLVITLDCGIKSHDQISKLKDHGIETIVVDHHLLPDELPEAVAIVHPDLTKNGSRLELSGGGTAYMLSRELLEFSGKEKWLIDLAAISTVSDVVTLNHDNRILVKYGLSVLAKTRNLGLKYLLEVCGLQDKELSTYELGFMIGPRLNAAGRVAHPVDSFKLLITEDPKEAKAIAKKLDDFNKTRQGLLQKGIEEAEKIICADELDKNNIIILSGNWDEGIVGLIASKITDRFYKPSIVLSQEDGYLKGSARSIETINITEIIGKAKNKLISYGGHSQAAGLSLKNEDFVEFKKVIAKETQSLDEHLFKRKLRIDALINYKDLNLETVRELDKLAPFGPGNTRPVLAIEKAKIIGNELIGADKSHMKLHFEYEEQAGCCLIFSFEKKEFPLEVEETVDIAFTACLNQFRGNTKIDLMVEDVKKSR